MPRNCTGTLTPELEQDVQSAVRAARTCYGRALAEEPTLAGRIVLTLTVEDGGGLSECSLKEDTLHRPAVLECIQGGFLGTDFHAPGPSADPTAPTGSGYHGGCLKLEVPLDFVPQAAGDSSRGR